MGKRRYMSPNDARHQSLRPCYRTRRHRSIRPHCRTRAISFAQSRYRTRRYRTLQFPFLQSLRILGYLQRIHHPLNITIHEGRQVVYGITYTVVRYSPLRIIVSTNLCRTVARRYHRLATCRYIIDILLMLLIIYLRAQTRQSTFLVLRLVASLCTLNQYLLHFARIRVFPIVA